MKKLIFTLIAAIAVQVCFSQVTYYWVGGTTPAAGGWNTGTNWNTALDGSGTTRATTATSDILVFDGTNVGGSAPTTGTVNVSLTSQTIGKLVLQNNANVGLSRNGSGSTTTLTIGDDPNGDDLVVFPGCTLRLRGLTGSILLVLSSNAGASNSPPATTSATARIYGNIVLEEGDATYQNRFTSRYKGAFVFASGSTLTANAGYAYYPFGSTGSSTTPAANGVTFEAGSSYYYYGGLSPFGSNSTSFLVEFQQGSKFYFRGTPAANMFGNRSYSDVVVDNNATVTSNGSLQRIDSLRVETGATFITNTSGVTPIHGNIVINGTFKVPDTDPNRDNKVVIAGPATQTLSGTGTVILADLITSDASKLTLQKSITIDSVNRIIGTFTGTGYTVSGSAVTTTKAPASLNITGNLNVDSFLVKNISDFTGIEIGMSVTGSGIPANTVIINTSTTNNTFTLSKAVTGAATYAGSAVALNVFNAQGVLPVKFTSFTAALDGSKVKLTWNIATEDNVSTYVVERSANGKEFSSIASVKAAQLNSYNAIDEQPLKGANFYRIKAVDNDGRTAYTSIVKLSTSTTKGEISINPNPIAGRSFMLNLNNVSNDIYSLTLINGGGQKVYAQTLGRINGSANTSINLPQSIKPGMYSIVISSNDQQIIQRIIIQ
jgi:hypothetical protein